jgi:hypothetical protein
MEPPFGNRATLVIALVLVLAMLGAAFVLTKIGEESRRVHCSVHFPNVTCTPER